MNARASASNTSPPKQPAHLEQEVLEARRVDAHVALLGAVGLGRGLAGLLDVVLLIVEQLLLHVLGLRGSSHGVDADAVWGGGLVGFLDV